jgi:RNA polymerase subunit RPABC4/transcription elongation factor Spt4
MTVRNQTPTRFQDEISIISRWVFVLASAIFVCAAVLLVFVLGRDRHAPVLAVRCLLALMMGAVLACYVILIGYVNKDAERRGMSRFLWTLIAIFVPNGLGVVLYFVLRKPRIAHCPQCDAIVEPGFSFCPRCRTRLQPICPHCQHSVNPGDKFCPYCGEALEPSAALPPSASANQPT